MKLWSSNKPGDDADARSGSPAPQEGISIGLLIEATLLIIVMLAAAASTLKGRLGV